MSSPPAFPDLPTLATYLRLTLAGPANAPEKARRVVLLYGHNGVGKTQLSMAFKNIGRAGNARDTLYFNAYTEDLFSWDNDLADDTDHKLILNTESRFFAGLSELEMDNRIRPLLQRYADFDFLIDADADAGMVRFYPKGESDQPIKISRGEETMFIWCFFLAIMQLAMDGAEAYQWVKYIVIDDPISSLDEHNAIAVANHLCAFLARKDHAIKTLVSTHHALFFNVLWNEIKQMERKNFQPWLLARSRTTGDYSLSWSSDTPFFHHLALLEDLCRARESGQVYTHHFNALRSLLEKARSFHGHDAFSVCISQDDQNDPGATLYGRVVNIMSHGNYSFYDPVEMLQENREHFEKVLDDFLAFYPFNRASLPGMDA